MVRALSHLQIEEIRLLPGQEWPGAAGAWRFVRVQAGAAYWVGAECNRSLSAGEMVVAGPRIQGGVRASQINEVRLHAFHFLPDLLAGFFTLAERHFFEKAGDGRFTSVLFLPSTHPVTWRLAALLDDPEKLPTPARRAELLGLAVSVFSGDLAQQRPPASRALSAHHRFQQLIVRMTGGELINHTPENLARLCGCSPRHFSRLFQHQFGCSVRERQTELRLLKASELLRDPALPVATAAAGSGYRHLSLFNAVFKRKFGMTPTEWRRENSVPC